MILALVVVIGVQGIFIHRLSTAMEKETPVDSGPTLNSNRSDPLGFSDPWGKEFWEEFNQAPFERMNTMREEMNRMFNGGPFSGFNNDPFFGQGLFSSPMDGFGFSSISGFEIRMEDDEVVVTGKLPGGDKSNVEVTVEDHQLHIAARTDGKKSRTSQHDDLGNMARRSQFSSRFEKRISLPEDMDPAGMRTEFEDGILTVRIPRKSNSGLL
ncbi:MAG: Hsp20/alpha crystallin family protein [Magnetococcales bacterium]|nr:Hsp20/alpha crystallin family protein [Magnetococcales bacterium]